MDFEWEVDGEYNVSGMAYIEYFCVFILTGCLKLTLGRKRVELWVSVLLWISWHMG